MRKAGDLIAEYMREKVLAEHRQNPIGRGAYGIVYESDVPGNVIKQMERPQSNSLDNATLLAEASNQAIAAELGIAPSVAAVETFPGGIGDRIEMSDIRNNFEGHEGDDLGFPVGRDAIRVNQQLGQLALNGVAVEDRHSGNVFYNKMTGRPMQIDFGIADRMSDDQQAAWLAEVTAQGFDNAGIGDIGNILRATVMDYLEGGQVAEAMDVAKQGFSRLQKIK